MTWSDLKMMVIGMTIGAALWIGLALAATSIVDAVTSLYGGAPVQ